jgi:hypothetical protein
MLLGYVRFLFDPALAPYSAHDALVTQWAKFISKKRPEVTDLKQGEIWVLLNMVLKSSTLMLCSKGPPQADARLAMFTSAYVRGLQQLVLALFCESEEIRDMDVLTMVPLFMKDLLGLVDRGVVFEMIFGYITWLNSKSEGEDLFLATVKFTFIKIITNYQYYIPLSMPVEVTIPAGQTGEKIHQLWIHQHFFVGLVLQEVRAGLLKKQRIREQAIQLLKDLLHSHDMDERLSEPEAKARVIALYFPFVITVVEFHGYLEDKLDLSEKNNWLLCFFYIIENCPRSLLHQWWSSSGPERNSSFLIVLEIATVVFRKDRSLYDAFCFIVVDMILDYITRFQTQLQEPDNMELPQVFRVLQRLQYNQNVGFVVAFYNLLAAISNQFSRVIFK